MNPQNGYKITKYLNDTRVCNQDDQEDLRKCMQLLKYFHQQDLKVEDEEEKIKLIDWEYAAMQDIHLDIAMFCIYSMYNRQQVDNLIDIYFENKCDQQTRIKIYCYISMCGLLWSNWCEYKRNLGVEFGEYSLRQYRYAKDYYRIVQEELKKQGEEE